MFEGFGFGGGGHRRLEARIARVERMLKAIIDHLGIDYNDDKAQDELISDEVRRYVREGRSIDAIKQYREETGAGLAEAKQTIDALMRRS